MNLLCQWNAMVVMVLANSNVCGREWGLPVKAKHELSMRAHEMHAMLAWETNSM